MIKQGLIHDYDLMANAEPAARAVTCAICDTADISFQWSDYSGEAMCTVCGCPYQLKWGNDEQVRENKYPYLSLHDTFIPIAREFWRESKTWVHYGASFSRNDGHPELSAWMKKHYPDYSVPTTS